MKPRPIFVLALALVALGAPRAAEIIQGHTLPVYEESLAPGCHVDGSQASPYNCLHRLRMLDCLVVGSLQISFAPEVDASEVVEAHGGSSSNLEQRTPPPFDEIDREVGIDRSYLLRVPVGRELALLREYLSDPKVEQVDLTGGNGPKFSDLWGGGDGSPCFGPTQRRDPLLRDGDES